MTHAEWLEVCEQMCRLWPSQPVPPETAEAWYPLLKNLDGADVLAAVKSIALEPDNRFRPAVGQIFAVAEGSRTRHWEEALAELQRLARQVGAYKPKPAISDPALEAVVDAWGWQRVCAASGSDPTVRAQFRDAYQTACERVAEDQRLRIVGQAGAGAEPRAIGDRNGGGQ